MKNSRIYLSPPNVGSAEKKILSNVIDEGWISSVGPSINRFEKNLEKVYSTQRVLALNSGTSALHLSLVLSEIKKGDHVLISSFTFAACANVIFYQGAVPIFIDSESDTWNLDPHLLREYLKKSTLKPKAIMVTHLYGMPAKLTEIKEICDEYELILIEDAAEAVGSKYENQPLGSLGDYGILSFNGNKIMTTSGGGALLTDDKGYDKGLHLSTQANSGKMDYYHKEIGYNYRMSNVLAGIGVVQLEKLEEFVSKKRLIFDHYREHLSQWFEFPNEIEGTFCNRWLTTPIAKRDIDINALTTYLDKNGIESRRLWRPMHLQPVFEQFDFIESGVSERLYQKGICLPSGTGLMTEELDYVIDKIKAFI